MCGNCSDLQNNIGKTSEESTSYKFAFFVLFLITCSSLGLSCYALVKVQSVSEELSYLKLVKERISAKTADDLNNFSDQIRSEALYSEQKLLPTADDSSEITERNRRSLPIKNSESNNTAATKNGLATNSGETITQQPPNLLENEKNLHNIRKKAVDYEENSESESFTPEYHNIYRHRTRGGRNNNQLEIINEFSPQAGRLKSLSAIHFNGDTSKYVYGQHNNFNGNGHLRHPQKTFVDWKESDWVGSIGTGNGFDMRNGLVTVKESGLYFVYSQVYYLDEHDMNGYRVYRNSDTLLQCTVTSHSSDRMLKGNTCYTAGVTYLDVNDSISVGDITDGRYSLFEPGKSFFGMIRLGDAKIK